MTVIAATIGVASCSLLDALHPKPRVSVLWHVTGKAAAGPPAFDGTTAFFLTDDHHVIALDAQTGAQRWRSLTDSATGSTYGYGGCVVSGEVVACGDNDIVAFHRSDGSFAWRYHANVGYSPGTFPFRAFGGTIYTGSPSGTMYAIDAASGAERWVAPALANEGHLVSITQLSVDSDLVVGAYNRFVKPERGGVMAVDAQTGQLRWLAEFPRPAPDSMTGGRSTALWKDVVFGSSTDGRIYALDRTTGAPRWNLPGVGRNAQSPTPWGPDWRPITVAENALFAGSTSGWFISYDIERRQEIGRTTTGDGSTNNSPIVHDGEGVYVIHGNGRLAAFSLAEPKVLWEIGSFYDGFYSTVAMGGDKLFASGITGFWAITK